MQHLVGVQKILFSISFFFKLQFEVFPATDLDPGILECIFLAKQRITSKKKYGGCQEAKKCQAYAGKAPAS